MPRWAAACRQVYEQGDALAVYDPVKDRHAWIANWGDGHGGFKVDRWPRIGAIGVLDPHTLAVTLHTLDGDQIVQVRLP